DAYVDCDLVLDCLLIVLVFIFFFFQAEDGIRDKLVTGVQTCALPISRLEAGEGGPNLGHFVDLDLGGGDREAKFIEVARQGGERSEERRVGKECRFRWSTNH